MVENIYKPRLWLIILLQYCYTFVSVLEANAIRLSDPICRCRNITHTAYFEAPVANTKGFVKSGYCNIEALISNCLHVSNAEINSSLHTSRTICVKWENWHLIEGYRLYGKFSITTLRFIMSDIDL